MLILVNGPPGVGKSALARRYVGDRPLALHLEIDAIRVSLGCWKDFDESKQIARNLGTAMAEAHLRAGHDVIVAQYLGRTAFIEVLERLAQNLRVDFVEILLLDTETAVADRFRARRVVLSSTGQPHPQIDLDELSISRVIGQSFERLKAVEIERSRTQVITVTDGLADAYHTLCRALAQHRSFSP